MLVSKSLVAAKVYDLVLFIQSSRFVRCRCDLIGIVSFYVRVLCLRFRAKRFKFVNSKSDDFLFHSVGFFHELSPFNGEVYPLSLLFQNLTRQKLTTV